MSSTTPPGGPSWHQEPAAPHPAGPPASSSFFRWLRGLDITRAPDRWVGGVAGGVARRTGLDIALVRGLIVILAIFGGIGVLLYGLAWALLPEPDGRIHVEQAGWGSWTSGLTGAAALVVIGLWRPYLPLLEGGGLGGLLWTLFWVGAVGFFVYWIVNRSTGGPGRPIPGGPGGPAGTGRPGSGPVPPSGPASWPGGSRNPVPAGPPSAHDGEGPATDPPADAGGPATGSAGASTRTEDGPSAGDSPDSPGAADTPGASGASGADAPSDDDAVHRTVPLPYQPRAYAEPWTPQSYPTQPLPYEPGPASWSASTYPTSSPGPVAGRAAVTRYRPPQPSGPTTALLVGGAITVGATLLAVDYLGALDLASPGVVALAAASIVLALGVIGLGIRGRTSGFVGFAAALAVIGALIASFTLVGGAWIIAQESRTAPASPETASNGYSVLAAQTTIDLTGLTSLSSDVVVPVNSLASAVTVVVPDDVPVEVRTRMALGSAGTRGTLEGPDGTSTEPQSAGGVLQVRNGTLNPDATGSAILLDVRGAMSDVSVVTAPGSGDTSSNRSTDPTGDTP
ncbi:PspC domain-containing protein [Arthrobacter sp. TMS1-12-1]